MSLAFSTRRLWALLAVVGFVFASTAGCSGRDDDEEDLCAEVTCDDPPANTCDGDVVVSFAATGLCTDGECTYHEDMRTPCDTGETCVNAACVPDQTGETCEDIEPCDDPPADACDGNVRVVYPATGTCTEGTSGPSCDYTPTTTDCADDYEVCALDGDDPVCVDLCDGVTCPAREDHCDNGTAVSYGGAEGTCAWQTGECEYPAGDETTDTCEVHQQCLVTGGDAECSDLPATCAEHGACETPPSTHCSDDGIVTYADTGTCDDSGGFALCTYEATTTACDDPDADYCDGNTLQVYDATGSCALDNGDPVCQYGTSPTDCAANDEVCSEDGAAAECVDLCDGETCPARDDWCDGDVAVNYGGAEGACNWETGDCDYPAGDMTTVDCTTSSEVCWVDGNDEAGCYPDPADQLCANDCNADSQCGRGIDLCVEFDDPGVAYCTHACDTEADCPDDYSCETATSVDSVTATQCVPDRGYCAEPDCYEAANCAHPHCAEHVACQPGFNFDFEDWTRSDPPAGFLKTSEGTASIIEDDTIVNTGTAAARLVVTGPAKDAEFWPVLPVAASEGESYVFHMWYQFGGRPDGASTGWIRQMLWFVRDDLSVAGNVFDNSLLYSEETTEWTEAVLPAGPAPAETTGIRPRVRMRGSDGTEDAHKASVDDPTVGWTDDWAVTVPYAFTLDQGNRDGADVDVEFVGPRYISAGVNNEGVLYASTNAADPTDNHDRVLYVWIGGTGPDAVAAPWSKAGTVVGPADGGTLLALVQEESNGYCEWTRWSGTEWVVVSTGEDDGTCTDTLGNIVAGIVDLTAVLAVAAHEIPTWIAFASAGYETANEGALVPATQVPTANTDADGNVDADETELVHRARLLVGKIHE